MKKFNDLSFKSFILQYPYLQQIITVVSMVVSMVLFKKAQVQSR